MTLTFCDHTGWNSWQTILRLISLESSLLAHPKKAQHHGSAPKGTVNTPEFQPEQEWGMENLAIGVISLKQLKIKRKLLLTA